jgi:type IX secretion system PorP/SprF family membrane protein
MLQFAYCISHAQDVHFSQYWESNVLRNPALTGIHSEEFKTVGSYRSQWTSMGKPYQTIALSAEGRLPLRHSEADFLTLSLLFLSDKSGAAALKTTGIYPCINYNKHLSDPHNSYLSAAFTAGYVQRSFDPGALTFDNMYQGGQLDPGLGAGETLPLNKMSYWDLGAGISYNSSIGNEERIHYIIGVAGYHFTQPKASFFERDAVTLAMRVNASFDLNFEINDVWSAQFHSNLAVQGPYKEAMIGGLLRWASLSDEGKGFMLSAGMQTRFGDALIPMLKVDFRSQSLCLSYDINNSALKAATKMRGGLEITAAFKGFFHGEENTSGYSPRF